LPVGQVDVHHLAHQHLRVALPLQHRAQRGGNVGRRQSPRGHLIQQRLEQMEIAAIDQRDLHIRGVAQSLRRVQTAKPTPNNYHSVFRFSHSRSLRFEFPFNYATE
jgi:hypothetical protein